jgi:aspartate oxidase
MYRIEYEKLGIVQSQVVMFAIGGYVQVFNATSNERLQGTI